AAATASAKHRDARRRAHPRSDVLDADRLVSDRADAGAHVRTDTGADFSGRGRRLAHVRAGRCHDLRVARCACRRGRDRGEGERTAMNVSRRAPHTAPSPRRGEGWGEGARAFDWAMNDRCPLTRLASLADLSPAGRGGVRGTAYRTPRASAS